VERKVAWGAVAAFVAFTVAMNAASLYAESSFVGIRARGRLRSWVDWYPLAIAGAIVRSRCGGSTETSAISNLRNVSGSQDQFRAACVVDEDGDGLGEYGTFADLSGAAAPRGRDTVLSPHVLSGAFRTRSLLGEVSRSGYQFRLWLPVNDGTFVSEARSNIGVGVLDPAAAETRWRCYSWPGMYDRSGLRTFYVDQTGDIWATEDERYSGSGCGPAPDAATARPGTFVDDSAGASASFTGADGNVWTRVN